MFRFSQQSIDKLKTCHYDLIEICARAILITPVDFSVICGFRNKKSQSIAFQENKSKLQWPNSKHNKWPSNAVDLAPYPIDWRNINRFYLLAGVILSIANKMEINIRWGGEWKDYGHFELQ